MTAYRDPPDPLPPERPFVEYKILSPQHVCPWCTAISGLNRTMCQEGHRYGFLWLKKCCIPGVHAHASCGFGGCGGTWIERLPTNVSVVATARVPR